MKELFLENKLAFIVVVAVLIVAFAVKKAVEYITKKDWKESAWMCTSYLYRQKKRIKNLDRGKRNLNTL